MAIRLVDETNEDIVKFIPVYPSLTEEDFSYQIAQREEFHELKLGPREEFPRAGYGIPLQHQELQRRMFSPRTPYTECLFYHQVGTGKSCSAALIIENFKHLVLTGKRRGKALIFVPNESIKKAIQEQIAWVCTRDTYFPRYIEKELISYGYVERARAVEEDPVGYRQFILETMKKDRPETYVARLNKMIGQTYEFHTYGTFLKDINPVAKASQYSNRIIILDEAHNLRIQPTRRKSKRGPLTIEKDPGIDSNTYWTMHAFLHNLKNCRVFLLSGTPIWDRVGEIGTLMNLILPDDQQILSCELIEACPGEYTKEDLAKAALSCGINADGRSEEKLCKAIQSRSESIHRRFASVFEKTYFKKDIIEDEDGKTGKYLTLTKPGRGDLKDKFRGRVSYLRMLMTTATRTEYGMVQPWMRYTTVYPSVMNYIQAEVAQRVAREYQEIGVPRGDTGEVEYRRVKGGSFHSFARGAVNFVFPIFNKAGTITRADTSHALLRQYIPDISPKAASSSRPTKRGGARMHGQAARKRWRWGTSSSPTDGGGFADPSRLAKMLSRENDPDLRHLARLSSKFAAIIRWIEAHPNENVFIYNELVTVVGGVINMALVLQARGYQWIKTAGDIAKPRKTGASDRFAVITNEVGTTSKPAAIANLITSFNRDDNREGQRCRILIGSRKIAEGLTIRNVRQVHIVSGYWNLSAVKQALGRVYRVGSHNDFPTDEERYIRIFRHISVLSQNDVDEMGDEAGIDNPDASIDDESYESFEFSEASEETSTSESFEFSDEGKDISLDTKLAFSEEISIDMGYDPYGGPLSTYETIDIRIYRVAEAKEYLNTQIYRLIKEISWDCPLTYGRNVLVTDVDGTRACDYQQCNYRCDGYPDDYIDRSGIVWDYQIPSEHITDSYDLYYSQIQVQEIKTDIIEVFQKYFNLPIEDIYDLVILDKDVSQNKKLLVLMALNQIINERSLIRDRFGFTRYLKEEGNIYFLDNTISAFANYPEVTYVSAPLVTESVDLKTQIAISELEADRELIQKACATGKFLWLARMSQRGIGLWLEKIYHQSLKDETTEREVITRSLEALPYLEITRRRVQHHLSPEGVRRYNPRLGKWVTVSGKLKKVNIRRPEIDEAGELTGLDERIHSKKEIVTREAELRNNPYRIFGRYKSNPEKGGDPLFSIVQLPRGSKGRNCTTLDLPKLLNIMFDLAITVRDLGNWPDDSPFPDFLKELADKDPDDILRGMNNDPRQETYRVKYQQFEGDDLKRIATLFSLKKEQICQYLEKWFVAQDLVLEIES